MSNNYLPHLLVIPEDDANRQMIVGFSNHLSVDPRKIHIANVAGGWMKALELFEGCHASLMRKFDKRHVLILIDFDESEDRIQKAKEVVPADLQSRVFVLGSFSDPERLSAGLNLKKEGVGLALADECVNKSGEVWGHPLLKHNQSELERMKSGICSTLLNE